MIFVVDQQLPQALCGWLADRGHDAEHVRNIGLRDARDSVIWRHAADVGAVVTTKDEDFAARRAGLAFGPQILWIRFGNVTNRKLFARLTPVWPRAESLLAAGEPIVEVE